MSDATNLGFGLLMVSFLIALFIWLAGILRNPPPGETVNLDSFHHGDTADYGYETGSGGLRPDPGAERGPLHIGPVETIVLKDPMPVTEKGEPTTADIGKFMQDSEGPWSNGNMLDLR